MYSLNISTEWQAYRGFQKTKSIEYTIHSLKTHLNDFLIKYQTISSLSRKLLLYNFTLIIYGYFNKVNNKNR